MEQQLFSPLFSGCSKLFNGKVNYFFTFLCFWDDTRPVLDAMASLLQIELSNWSEKYCNSHLPCSMYLSSIVHANKVCFDLLPRAWGFWGSTLTLLVLNPDICTAFWSETFVLNCTYPVCFHLSFPFNLQGKNYIKNTCALLILRGWNWQSNE